MKLLTLILFLTLPGFLQAQQISNIDSMEISYGHSFQGSLQQTIRRDSKGVLMLETSIFPNTTDHRARNYKPLQNPLTGKDLLPVLDFINDPSIRKSFLNKPIKPVLDGSSLSITVRQGSLSMTFSTQHPFQGHATPEDKKLVGVAGEFFKLAGIKTPPLIEPDKSSPSDQAYAITIPAIKIENRSLPFATAKLQELALAADPDKKGILLVFDPSINQQDLKPITLDLQNVPVTSVIDFLASLSDLTVKKIDRTFIFIKK